MNEEEKKAIEKFSNLMTKHFENKKIDTLDYLDYFEGITLLNLIDKQQKEIEFYKIQELGYIQGYEDGKRHKQTAVAIKNENAEQEFIQRKIEKQQKEIKELKHFKEEVIEIIKYADDTAEPTYWNIRKLLGLGDKDE